MKSPQDGPDLNLAESEKGDPRRGTVVYDSNYELASANRCFEATQDSGCGTEVLPLFYEETIRRGFCCQTGDVFLEAPTAPAYLVTEMVSARTADLIASGAIPAICMCGESPIVARSFYHDLTYYAGRFKHAILFAGASSRLAGKETQFHAMHFPISRSRPLEGRPWHERKPVVIVNSNKCPTPFIVGSLRSSITSLLHWLRRHLLLPAIDPWMRSPDLYRKRLQWMRFFAAKGGLSLYGYNWDRPIAYGEKKNRPVVAEIWRGALETYEKKLAVLAEHRFVLCLENTVFPGYVTEKIFDCFLAGAIPVYYGAPDITDFVPQEAFIDSRRFKNLQQLYDYIQGVKKEEAASYREAGAAFLKSKSFGPHLAENYARHLVDLVAETAGLG